VKPHLFEALLPWQAAEELSGRISARSIRGEDPERTFLGQIIYDDVLIEIISKY